MIKDFILEVVLILAIHSAYEYGKRILNAISEVQQEDFDENVEKSSHESEK